MSKTTLLPVRLCYLEAFRKKFAGREIENLNEDTGMAPLFELLAERTANLVAADAEKLLSEDMQALQRWLAEPEQKSDCLHFAAGVLLVMSPAEILKQIGEASQRQKEPRYVLKMDLPEGAKLQRLKQENNGGMLVKWNDLMYSVTRLTEAGAEKYKKGFTSNQDPNAAITESPVKWGEVWGSKYLIIRKNQFGRPEKTVDYVLKTGAAHAAISLIFAGQKPSAKADPAIWQQFRELDRASWDEKEVELLIPTLRSEVI